MKSLAGWGVVQRIARALDPAEREVVLGDLAELGESWSHALRQILGLVVRREAALWMSPRPWLIVIAVAIPLGLLISVLSRIASGGISVYVWMYANNSDWDLLKSAGFWYVLRGASFSFLVQCLTLACWSWIVGFVIGAMSGKFVRRTAFIFLCILLAGEISFAPRYLAFCWQLRDEVFHTPVVPAQSDPVSALLFYRVVFPFLVQIVLVAAPALWAVGIGSRLGALGRALRTVVWVAAILSVAMLVTREPGLGLLLYPSLFWFSGPVHLLQPIVYWPIAYLLTAAIRERLSLRAA